MAEKMTCTQCGMPCDVGEFHPYAACLMFKGCHNSAIVRANLTQPKILDAEGDGGAVDFPRYRATGFDAETNCAEMVADPDGAWVHVMDIPQVHPARSGVVSDEDVEAACVVYDINTDMRADYPDIGAMRAALEHFAKG